MNLSSEEISHLPGGERMLRGLDDWRGGRVTVESCLVSLATQKFMKRHVAEAERIQSEIIRKMTPAQKFAIARGLYETAWEIKRSALSRQHSDWTEEQVLARVRQIFNTGYEGDDL